MVEDRIGVRLTAIDRRNLATLAMALGRPLARRGNTSELIRHALAVAVKVMDHNGPTGGLRITSSARPGPEGGVRSAPLTA